MLRYDTLYSLCVVLALSVTFISCDCPAGRKEQDHDEVRLNKDLLCAYNTDIRPVSDHRTTVTVSVTLAINYITFDDLEEIFTVHALMTLSWKDQFLKWNPSDYGNIQETSVHSGQIWTPSMALFNADASSYQSDRIYATCSIDNEGNVTCTPLVAHSGICSTSLRNWPYDVQNCYLYFGTWMNTGEQVNYTFERSKPVVLDDVEEGPGWKLLNVVNKRLSGEYSCCPNSTYPMLKYTFMLKRIAAGPAAIIVIPSAVIVMLTLVSLVLDVKDKIRLILICFSLYGHFVFVAEIGYQIPKHSSETPIVLLFLRDSMIVTLVGIFETLFLMYLRQRVIPAPGWIMAVNRLVNSGPGKYVVFTEFDPSEACDTRNLTDDISTANEEKARAHIVWIQFANLLNSLLFIMAIIVYSVLIATYIPSDN